jgi:large subunit ribosomal protein L24
MAAKIKKGDTVIVLAGKDRTREGRVVRVMPKEDRCVVEGLNVIKRHTKPSQATAGGIMEREAPIHLSNVALKDPKDGKPTRVGFEVRDGKKVRVAKRSREVIDV